MSDHKTFALAGAGQVGHAFAEEFVKDKNVSLKILTRIGSIGVNKPEFQSLVNKGATVLGVDYADHTSLVEALQGIDVVISTFGTEGLAHQPALARAAKEAGAKLFVPSEFGVDTDRKDVLPTAPAVVKNKKQFREELEQIGLPWTGFITGLFANLAFTPYFGFDFASHKARIVGSGNVLFSVSTLPDIARFAHLSLTQLPPSSLHNRLLHFESWRKSWKELVVDDVQSITGDKWEVEYVPVDRSKAEEPSVEGFFAWLHKTIEDNLLEVGKDDVETAKAFEPQTPKEVIAATIKASANA